MRLLAPALLLLAPITLLAEPTLVRHLSGTGSDDTVPWEFRLSGGRGAGEWTTIAVPSNWETQGFGTFRYWKDWGTEEVPDKMGYYRHRFAAPAEWRGKHVELVFGGAMTDTTARLNGQPVGPTHRGGFYEFRYDVTALLRSGEENVLEVEVQRFSADESVNRAERQADYWLFSGIYRPVWLEVSPVERIAHVALDARHDGAFAADLELAEVGGARRVVATIRDSVGQSVGEPLKLELATGQTNAHLTGRLAGVRPWSAEWPNLYTVEFALHDGAREIHHVSRTFGFRTIEVREGMGLYVNGQPVRIRGTNRHSIYPTTGRATSRTLSEQDVALIKGMNMNAVRMSHYPPDAHFLETCDRLGLYVIDELAGWQAAYSTEAGRPLVAEMVRRDVNHPSIILWDNGNEGGWNTALDGEFAKHDPQRRTVLHPWAEFGGINTSHYEIYGAGTDRFFQGDSLIMPTEFLHGLYDGGAGAGLDDWWNILLRHPLGVGGFLWAFVDEGVVRNDEGGRIDVAGNAAPDGCVGPFRQKEGSYDAIREIWSPVYFPLGELDRLPSAFDGELRVENRYDFTNLCELHFTWELRHLPGPSEADAGKPVVVGHGTASAPNVPARGVGSLSLGLPADWREYDALALTAIDPQGREIYTWTWMITRAPQFAARIVPATAASAAAPAAEETETALVLRAGDTTVVFDRATGELREARRGAEVFPLRNGPRIVGGEAKLKEFTHRAEGGAHIIECGYEGMLQRVTWRLDASGWLRLDYVYRLPENTALPCAGVTFDHATEGVTGMRWLGKGPYRVWKNRLKGAEFDVWAKMFNDTATGQSWDYPEFKGFHAGMYWAVLGGARPMTIVFGSDDLFLRLFTPAEGVDPKSTHVEFPPGDLSIMHGIAPIGTKFHTAAEHGPQGAPNFGLRHGLTTSGTVWFRFGAQ
ncbi:MAG TPA: glycoside hydrolase family 2 TIM barrel-domain containing protein [Opitutaceae bacterium]|nr:glycoside hydrolase family 2 TIM barrel-domain containing protein [Opitutaceae bacterium]